VIIRHERRKLLNAILFFASNTNKCGITKLFKLLYFLDFEHFKMTGRSVTGLQYNAWPKGPVPVSLKNEIGDWPPPDDLFAKISVDHIQLTGGKTFQKISPIGELDLKVFSKRELKIMERLAQEYKSADADSMVEETHLETLPWHQVYNVEGKKQKRIPYEYAVRKDDIEFIKCLKKESDEVLSNYTS
jgi:uncharacterized phage-associated protein